MNYAETDQYSHTFKYSELEQVYRQAKDGVESRQ